MDIEVVFILRRNKIYFRSSYGYNEVSRGLGCSRVEFSRISLVLDFSEAGFLVFVFK